MNGFNFLCDAPPLFIERLRTPRIAGEAVGPLVALFAVLFVLLAWNVLERTAISAERVRAREERRIAAASLLDLRRAHGAYADLATLRARDERLRSIRLSGARVAAATARLANRVPRGIVLTKMAGAAGKAQLEGRARDVVTLGELMSGLTRSEPPSLVRATRGAAGTLDFAVSVENRQ